MSNIKIVEIPFERIRCDNWQTTWKASEYGIELVHWLKDEGLILYKDFEWSLNTTDKLIQFKFFESAKTIPTMFALRFGSGNK